MGARPSRVRSQRELWLEKMKKGMRRARKKVDRKGPVSWGRTYAGRRAGGKEHREKGGGEKKEK